MPTAFSEYEKSWYPRVRNRSLQTTTAMPASRPMVTRPAGPIQLLSNAYFRKYATPISTAEMPMRFSQCEPMRDSKSMSGSADANTGRAGIGGRGFDSLTAGDPGTGGLTAAGG